MATASLESMFSSDRAIPLRERVCCVWRLSLPAILAQITSVVMQYIDAAMVGQLGAAASASIGLTASTDRKSVM